MVEAGFENQKELTNIFFKQKKAYDERNSDWSSDVCSSDLSLQGLTQQRLLRKQARAVPYRRPKGWQHVGLNQVMRGMRGHASSEQQDHPVGGTEKMTHRNAQQAQVQGDAGNHSGEQAE